MMTDALFIPANAPAKLRNPISFSLMISGFNNAEQ